MHEDAGTDDPCPVCRHLLGVRRRRTAIFGAVLIAMPRAHDTPGRICSRTRTGTCAAVNRFSPNAATHRPITSPKPRQAPNPSQTAPAHATLMQQAPRLPGLRPAQDGASHVIVDIV